METKDLMKKSNRKERTGLVEKSRQGLITNELYKVSAIVVTIALSCCLTQCKKDESTPVPDPVIEYEYNIEQAISDEAQRNTIAFDGLAFMTGNLGSQSFLPPGKVADYSGFQHLRDNDPTKLGHNTSFVTIISFNILHILSDEQIQMFVDRAQNQIDLINAFAYKRYPLLQAFRRLIENELPVGTTTLNKEAVMAYVAELYRIDGKISYDRAQLFGEIIQSLSAEQKSDLDALVALQGIGNWDDNLSNPLEGLNLSRDISVAVMTYASEIYSWYAGTVTSDVYFCPERHGTYFGSFYLKDWPAMGNPDYTIDETLTASAGQNFLAILSASQSDEIKGIVDLQRNALNELVERRKDISTELRKFLASQTADSSNVLSLSERYGEMDGEMSYYYATHFAQVFNSLSSAQKEQLFGLADQLGYLHPTGGFLYSEPVPMLDIESTDFFFE
jgi:hypothetical protein